MCCCSLYNPLPDRKPDRTWLILLKKFVMIYLNIKYKPKRKPKKAVGELYEKYKPLKFQDIKCSVKTEENKILIPSSNIQIGNTYRKERPKYTGDKLIGIAVMHKSNLVPVFSTQEAIEISKMRRG